MWDLAGVSAPQDLILGGSLRFLTMCHDRFVTRGLAPKTLDVPYAFHCAQMDVIMEPFARAYREVKSRAPSVPVSCPLTGQIITDEGVFGAEHMVPHLRATFNFQAAMAKSLTLHPAYICTHA